MMNERLIWNFELAHAAAIDFEALSHEMADAYKWEARAFWKHDATIVLHGLTADILSLGNATFKTHDDVYVLIPNTAYNLKYRKNHLVYKPLIQQNNGLYAYDKKIKLDEMATADAAALKALVTENGHNIAVLKEAVSFEFPTTPKIKLELSKLIIGKTTYFSACIEGKSATLVGYLHKVIMADTRSCDYPTFLTSEHSSC